MMASSVYLSLSLLVFLTAMKHVLVYISYRWAEGGDSKNTLVFFSLSLYKLSTSYEPLSLLVSVAARQEVYLF